MRYRLSNPAPSKLSNSLAGSALGTDSLRQKLTGKVDRLPHPTPSSLSKNEHKKPRSPARGFIMSSLGVFGLIYLRQVVVRRW